MKEIIINVPDNCEVKQNGNTYTVVEKENKLIYNNVAKTLFCNTSGFYISDCGDIRSNDMFGIASYKDANNCISEKQAKKLLAINKLMNVAKYLNGDWQPDWDYMHEKKYYISIEDKQIKICYVDNLQCSNTYFKSKELAEQAIEILGEETIKLALCTDY